MPFKIYTYADPYHIHKTDFWKDIKYYPHLCASRTMVRGLISTLPDEEIQTLICPLDAIVNNQFFEDWAKNISTDKQLTDYLFDVRHIYDADHIGKRSGSRGTVPPLEAFIKSHPEAEWKNTLARVSKIAREKAARQVIENADFETAKREITRIVNGYESEYLYLGRDMSKIEKIKEKYEAVYYALSHPLLVLDAMALIYLNRR